MGNCLICSRISQIEKGNNHYFVKELKTGYVVIGDTQYARGYTLFLSKIHANELHELDNRNVFLEEMAIVAEAVFKAFKPDKLNYELLGNTDEHLHWHLIPRYNSDPYSRRAYWMIPRDVRNSSKFAPSDQELRKLKENLLTQL